MPRPRWSGHLFFSDSRMQPFLRLILRETIYIRHRVHIDGESMTDQRKEVINQLHELNILILHTKLKATRAQTALRAATRVRNVEAARRGVAPLQQLPKSSDMATHMLECLNEEELSTLSELLQRIIDNTDTRLLGEEYAERRKAIHEFLMLNHTDTEVQE